MKKLLPVLFLLLAAHCFGQNRNSVWCFGDSALIDFSDTSNIFTGTSSVNSRGSCASICDTSGTLLFYVSYDQTVIIGGSDPVKAYNINHQVMQNGDSMKGGGWYREVIILPYPASDSLFYIFYIGVTLDLGFYYAIVDMSANNGLGAIIQKNVQLQSFKCSDGLIAIKHGNGRDWWVFIRRWDNANNSYYKYLISPTGVSNPIIQNIGTVTDNSFSRLEFSGSGDKMALYNYRGLLELYDFDRCTGIISTQQVIFPETSFPFSELWSVVFSPSGNLLYASHSSANSPDSCYLTQLDLTSSNIANSADTLWQTTFVMNMGQLKLAPDNKIYLTNNYTGSYPYKDTTYNTYNMNLSVISSPDSLGSSCNLQPYSFYLGGKRTYYGLPNNPDYEMPALPGSPCDTITSIPNAQPANTTAQLQLTYITSWQTLFVNAQNLKSKNCLLQVFDVSGKLVYSTTQKTVNGYFTCNVPLQAMAKGVYVVKLVGDVEVLGKRFVRE